MAKLPAEEPVSESMVRRMDKCYIGRNIHKMSNAEKKEFTKHVQMIFQDPYSSLDSRLKVHDIIVEGMRIHKLVRSKEEEYSGSVVKAKM